MYRTGAKWRGENATSSPGPALARSQRPLRPGHSGPRPEMAASASIDGSAQHSPVRRRTGLCCADPSIDADAAISGRGPLWPGRRGRCDLAKAGPGDEVAFSPRHLAPVRYMLEYSDQGMRERPGSGPNAGGLCSQKRPEGNQARPWPLHSQGMSASARKPAVSPEGHATRCCAGLEACNERLDGQATVNAIWTIPPRYPKHCGL